MLKIAAIWGSCAGVLYVLLTWLSLAKRQELNTIPAWGLISTALYILVLGIFIFIAIRANLVCRRSHVCSGRYTCRLLCIWLHSIY